MPKRLLERWETAFEEINDILEENPSARGLIFGYVAEYKLRKLLRADPRVTNLVKYADHDRTKKGDMTITYKGTEVSFESKSLQSAEVKKTLTGYSGTFQCDASDRRTVTLPGGEKLETTCLLIGEFDILAVNLYQFGETWRFAFATNEELPRSRSSKYTPKQQESLLATSMRITWPLEKPYHEEPWGLLDEIVRRRAH